MKTRRLGGALWLAAAGLALGVMPLSTPAAASAAAEPSDERIVYLKGCDLWIASPTGAGAKRLATGTTCGGGPSISHTGRYVAYQRISGASSTLVVIDLATGVSKDLTAGALPDFSPTADTIAYNRYDTVKKVTDIYTINVDGTGLTNWTNDVEGPELDFNGNYSPVWAADGASIYFSRSNATYFCRVNQGGYDDIYTANTLQRISTPGGSLTPVVDNSSWDVYGGSEYDGALAYTRSNLPGGPDGGYCTSEPDTTSYVVLDGTVVGKGDWSPPRWSPDGTRLYFGGEDSVRSVPADGGTATTLFAGRSPDVGPAYAGADDRIPTSLVLGFRSAGSCTPSGCKTTGIDAKGTLQPKHSGSTVSVRLDAYRKGAWRKIGVRTPTTDKFGRYQASFGKPRGSICRLTASFAGDKTYLPSQLVRRLAC